jgi:hypothetical protein
MAMNTDDTIPKELRDKYLLDLVRDSRKDFGAEFIRTTNLEVSLIRQFGFDGLKLISASSKSEVFQLGSLPLECPWSYLNGKTHDAAIDAVFEPISHKVPQLISKMKERVRFIYTDNAGTTWKLHYFLDMKLYDDRDYFLIYSGGMPEPDPGVGKSLSDYKWSIPKDLKEFYAVHNGFGAPGDSRYILRSNELTVMGEMMNPIAKAQNVIPEGYAFNDLLEFFPDGAGNAQCFLRKANGLNSTVDWDHETWEISEESGFFEFIDDRMSELDEE